LWSETSQAIKVVYNPRLFPESFVLDTFFCKHMIYDEVNKV
jgi:hypothetical protein